MVSVPMTPIDVASFADGPNSFTHLAILQSASFCKPHSTFLPSRSSCNKE
jgi:hypothetical protein